MIHFITEKNCRWDFGGPGIGVEPDVASADRTQYANRQRVHRYSCK
jgi:hypothetical protein